MNLKNKPLNHVKRALELIPISAPAAVVMRHAERGKFARGHHGNDILLTPQGERDAFEMGALMEGRVSRLLHSPVPRCLQTAENLRKGGCVDAHPREWLGLRCDVYVDDFNLALDTLTRLVSEDGFYDVFVDRMSVSGEDVPYPHFKPPLNGTGDLIRRLCAPENKGMCVAITHDWLVNVAASYATGAVTGRSDYAGFLDALFVWLDDGLLMFYYKGRTGRCPSLIENYVMANH